MCDCKVFNNKQDSDLPGYDKMFICVVCHVGKAYSSGGNITKVVKNN